MHVGEKEKYFNVQSFQGNIYGQLKDIWNRSIISLKIVERHTIENQMLVYQDFFLKK